MKYFIRIEAFDEKQKVERDALGMSERIMSGRWHGDREVLIEEEIDIKEFLLIIARLFRMRGKK